MKVAIIGGGAAGAATAYKLKTRKHDVTVFQDSPGATGLSSGTLDLFPFRYATLGNVSEAFSRLSDEARNHILFQHKIDVAFIKNALVDWSRIVEKAGLKFCADFEKGLLFLNTLGLPKWSLMAQDSFLAGELRGLKRKKVGVLIIQGNPLIHEKTFLRNTTHIYPKGWSWEPVSLSLNSDIQAEPDQSFKLALEFDSEKKLKTFAEEIKSKLPSDVQALALPPLFGVDFVDRNIDILSTTLGVPCFEVAAVQESVPGMRLFHALQKSLELLDIGTYEARVVDIEKEDHGVRVDYKLRDQSKGGFLEEVQSLHFDALISAGGRFIGGAIEMTQRGPRDGLLESRLVDNNRQDVASLFPTYYRYWGEGFFGRHRAMEAVLRAQDDFALEEGIYGVGSLQNGFEPQTESGGLVSSIALGARLGEIV